MDRVRRWFFREGYEHYPDWRGNRGVRRACVRAKETTIDAAEPGLCRITGRVRVLAPVACELLGTEVGAFWARTMTLGGEVLTLQIPLPTEAWRGPFHDTWACGRLAVVDPTGMALIDTDHVTLFRRDGRARMRSPCMLSVTDDTTVTVVGKAVRAPASYRHSPEALVFRGTWLSPIVLLI